MDDLHSYLYNSFSKDPAPVINFVQWLAQVHGLPPQLHMLDIGCGPGRLLAEYARLGWYVTGFEPDDDFYQAASQFALNDSCISVVQRGFMDLNAINEYDLITTINDPLAYLLEIDQRIEAMQRVYQALRPGGVFFLEIKNFFYKLAHHEPIHEEILEINGTRIIHIMEHEIDFHHAYWTHRDEYLIEGQSEAVIKHHRVAMISPVELYYHLQQIGFEQLRTYNNFDARDSHPLDGNQILISVVKP